jgi:queuosine precursor transporter
MGIGVLYLVSILLANILVSWFGIITVLGLSFPAGAIVIGVTFTIRDFVQQRWGKWSVWWWMFAASLITILFNQTIAIASFSAFVLSESLDWLLFTIWPGSFKRRVIMSNLISCPCDSIFFVWFAFGWLPEAMIGQTLVKWISSFIPLYFMKAK